MNRLAKKDLINTINHTMCSGSRLVGKKMFAQIITELCEYKTIEEELGIDLIILFKALCGIWVKSTNGNVYYVGSPYLCFSENEKRELEFQFRVGDTWYKIKGYGKNWALTKEELEGNKNGN